jgi:Mycothiol maleylpyruvate isomerase N-terminal domain
MSASHQTPIQVAHLFAKIDELLSDLLQSLTEAEWQMPTVAKQWRVKDIAAHLLDGNLRTLSIQRDQYFGETPAGIESYQNLVTWLNQLNATWVAASKRLSPHVLVMLLQATGGLVSNYYASLPLDETAIFSVAWAGEKESKNWLHLGREYTEKFIHQQQIRAAVGKPALITDEFFLPFMQIIMQALPFTFKDVSAALQTTIKISIMPSGGTYYLVKQTDDWQLENEGKMPPIVDISLDSHIAWQLFSGSMSTSVAVEQANIKGDASLAQIVLSMRSFMV